MKPHKDSSNLVSNWPVNSLSSYLKVANLKVAKNSNPNTLVSTMLSKTVILQIDRQLS